MPAPSEFPVFAARQVAQAPAAYGILVRMIVNLRRVQAATHGPSLKEQIGWLECEVTDVPYFAVSQIVSTRARLVSFSEVKR